MEKLDPTLKTDDPGVARHKFIQVVDEFLVRPHAKEICSDKKDNSRVLGLRGEGSQFWVAVVPFGKGVFCGRGKLKGETEVILYFQSDYDIKMQAEWSASITDPSGNELVTSQVQSTMFVKENGNYQNSSRVMDDNHRTFDVRMLEDPNFGLHKDIEEKGWLFDGALHVVVDVRFKVLEGGFKVPEGGYVKNCCCPVDPLLFALRSQIDSPIFPDFTLISADGVEIKTHKLIFTLQSPVFRAMFENDLEEARTGICKIEDANAVSIRAILDFLVGVEPKQWSFDLAKELFKLAAKYQLTALRDRSAMELAKRLTTKNLVQIMLLAHRYSVRALLNEAFHFLEDNFKKATFDGAFVRLAPYDVHGALAREWRAHWFKRQEGIEMEDVEECNMEDGTASEEL